MGFAEDGVLLESARDAVREGDTFRFVVQQYGEFVQAEDGATIQLDPAPFTLWVVFVEAPSVLVNASTTPDLYDPIAEGLDPQEALEDSFDLVMGIAETPYNLDYSLYVVPLSSHYLEHPSVGEHRFNRAVWHAEYAAGGRDVSGLTILSRGGDTYPMRRSPIDRIYVSGLHAPWGDDYSRVVEDSHAFILEW
jgi:hypothetical protein